MHEGTKRLVIESAREVSERRWPSARCRTTRCTSSSRCTTPAAARRWRKYSRFFSASERPAPGRGSSGVHESGFGRFNTETLGLSPNAIPTLQVVDDTFTTHRDTMAAIIARAKQRAGIV